MTDTPVTLITGGGSGIGAATAAQLLDIGHRVTVMGRGRNRLDDFAARLERPKELLVHVGDASEWEPVAAAVAATVEAFGRLDAVVANAGFAVPGNLETGDPRGWRAMTLTNVLGPALLIKAALPHLRQTKGRIVLVSSVAGFIYSPGNYYGATKWAVTGLAENTRRMVTGEGIGVTLVAPGAVVTNFWDNLGGLPERDFVSADQVAASIVWAIGQPEGVDVNAVTVRPIGQPM